MVRYRIVISLLKRTKLSRKNMQPRKAHHHTTTDRTPHTQRLTDDTRGQRSPTTALFCLCVCVCVCVCSAFEAE
jgi:hypothetical protein